MADGPGWLFVPADRPERYAKAVAGSDQAIIDLEDAVRDEAKGAAREMLRSSAVDPAQVCVRINGFGTPYFEKDLEAVSALGISRVMVPMAVADQPFGALEGFDVIALIETARGVVEADRVAAHPQVRGLALGSADLGLSLRTRRRAASALSGSGPIDLARMRILYAGRANECLVIDSALAAVSDEVGLSGEAEAACAHGFDGKLAIHPRQVEIIRSAFAPTHRETEWAEAVVAAARTREEGAFVLHGELVDEVVVRRAESLLRSH